MVEVTLQKRVVIDIMNDCGKTVSNDGIGQYILISIIDGLIEFITTDLSNMTIKSYPLNNQIKYVQVLVQYSLLSQSVKLFKDNRITLELDEKKNTVRLNGEFLIQGNPKFPPEDFPDKPEVYHTSYIIPDGKLFSQAIKRASLAMSIEEGKKNLEGLAITIREEYVSMSSADGRLGTLDTSIVVWNQDGATAEWFFPPKSLSLLDFEGEVHITLSKQEKLVFSADDTTLIMRMAQYGYPMKAVVSLFEKQPVAFATVASWEFLEKINLAKLSTSKVRGGDGKDLREYARIIVSFENNQMKIEPYDKAPHAKFEATIDCLANGEASFVMNGMSIETIDYLAKQERLTFGYIGQGQAIIVTSDGVPNYKTLIMPMTPV